MHNWQNKMIAENKHNRTTMVLCTSRTEHMAERNNNKRSNNTYDRENYQDTRFRNDRGRSPSRDRSNSQTRSPRSPGDNHQNGASFYDEKKKY
jgi:hypothetical protein